MDINNLTPEYKNLAPKNSKSVSDKKRAKTAEKRIAVQLEGLDIAEKLLNDIVKLGFADVKTASAIEHRIRAKKQENYYINGVMIGFRELGNYHINGVMIRFNELLEAIIIAQLNDTDEHLKAAVLLYQLISQGRAYLTEKLKNPLEIRTDTDLEEQLGFVWKTEKLIEAGLTIENAELAELYYIRDYNSVCEEWVTESSFINLKDGVIYRRINCFPDKRNLIITDDYSYDVLNVSQAVVFPGVINRRIRFAEETVTTAAFSAQDVKRIREFAEKDFSAAVKNAKNILRNPLNSQHVIALLEVSDIFETEDKQSVITDKNGFKIALSENRFSYRGAKSWLDKSRFINSLSKEFIIGNTICVSLEINLLGGTIYAAPLSIINDNEIIRLL
jgi:hypothetical protein